MDPGGRSNQPSPMPAPALYDQHPRHRSGSYTAVPPSPNHYRNMPASPTAGRLPPSSPNDPRDRPTSSYYDPTSEARVTSRDAHANPGPGLSYQPRSPIQVSNDDAHERPRHLGADTVWQSRSNHDQRPTTPAYMNGNHLEQRQTSGRQSNQTSPVGLPHAHPAPPAGDPRSPIRPFDPARPNGMHSHTPSLEAPPPPAAAPRQRTNNPMSMTNLLSESEDLPKPAKAQTPPPPPTSKPTIRKASRPSSSSTAQPRVKEEEGVPSGPSQPHPAPEREKAPVPLPHQPPAPVVQRQPLLPQTGPPGLTVRDTEKAWAEIQELDLSDVETDDPRYAKQKEEYVARSKKRTLELSVNEGTKRKRRRLFLMKKWHEQFTAAADAERAAYIDAHEHEVEQEVRMKELEEEKERKKDQQRKRRREKAIADEKLKRDEALQSLADAQDEEEKARIEKDIERASKKIRDTEWRLQGVTPTKELRNESPHAAAALGKREREVVMDGGLMTSFHTNHSVGEDGTPELVAAGRGGRARGGRGGGAGAARAKKSKEQKQAEKESAARAQAFLDQGQDLPPLAPKEEERLRGYAARELEREESEGPSEMTPAAATALDVQPTAGLTGMAKFDSKGYQQIYEQINRDIAKGVPKVVRIKNNSLDTKQSNARKTAQLAAKEARRWQLRTNKSTKDVAARAKRAMREMLGFWKRNERDEREGRKVAERQALDKARQAEAEREANRQKRKLNFLISQTELYSHFIGKKVKTDEIEKHGMDRDGVVPSGQTTTEMEGAEHTVGLPDSHADLAHKVTKFEDLDFDAEDESVLREAAMANAQNAVKEAQDRAREFDNTDANGNDLARIQQDFDEGEMNFQNPTSLQSMDVPQPKMLTCQLKEYQLKGLNWLVNLYEQGINGILADEMGLGKTVQSISVMAYLAEVHNIWGPFLVIAPASTLHNWQQEITRFVPNIKVLPYWGSAKDRKILRKFWDRKHITYTRDSPFHVLVTSYQLVVHDTPYFQKIKWQYMILDEAQAIKSSQSSRWKALLGFHCRNRLLLTGTPIQNNMQELWALLHFIMPSLFDSHDEFSEWFSKDIENHAQSNTKLNEDQLRRLHMILKPFMLRRVKKHVQKELGDKIEEDVFCDLTYRQRALYSMLRHKISILDLIEKAAVGDDQDTATLMNLVMQFRKVCNHPDLFERADTWSPLSISAFAETASFMREGQNINVSYSVRNLIDYWLPKMLGEDQGRLDAPGPGNLRAGWLQKTLRDELNVWNETNIRESERLDGAFAWLRFVDQSASDVADKARKGLVERAVDLAKEPKGHLAAFQVAYDAFDEQENAKFTPAHSMLQIVERNDRKALAEVASDGRLASLYNVSRNSVDETGYAVIEACYLPRASAPPVELVCPSHHSLVERETTMFNVGFRRALYPITTDTEAALLQTRLPPFKYPVTDMLPAPASLKKRYTDIQVPSMRRFVTDSGKLARLDRLLRELKEGGHRVLLYFQMTRMIDLMEEYLTYRNYKYCRLDGSTKLEDRRDTVAAFQSSSDIFVFLLSTRAGGLGINLTSADTVIFYDSDWNPTIDSQAMDRAHRLGQTRQVTVYRLITRGTIEERIRKRALQKEEVQRVVISGQAGGGDRVVDFNNRTTRESNRTKDIAMWLADDDQAAAIERREAEVLELEAKEGGAGATTAAAFPGPKKKRKAPAPKRKEVSMDDMYHEGSCLPVSAIPLRFSLETRAVNPRLATRDLLLPIP